VKCNSGQCVDQRLFCDGLISCNDDTTIEDTCRTFLPHDDAYAQRGICYDRCSFCLSDTNRCSVEAGKRIELVFRHIDYNRLILHYGIFSEILTRTLNVAQFFLISRHGTLTIERFVTLCAQRCLQHVSHDAEDRAVSLRQLLLVTCTSSST